jgi:hypothetical protein
MIINDDASWNAGTLSVRQMNKIAEVTPCYISL